MKPVFCLLLTIAIGRCAGATCEQLSRLTFSSAAVNSATTAIDDGQSYCRVVLTAAPAPDSEIRVEMWLPNTASWNGKFLGTGKGGYSSQMSVGPMRAALRKGYAVAGSDTGHSGGDLKFGVGHPAKIEDWAYRAIHAMSEAAQPVLRSYYGRFAEHSYFCGCSTGGQQALSEAQRYPGDYDGIIAGDPGNDRIHLNAGFLWSWRAVNRTPESQLPAAKLATLYEAVMAKCDALDAIKDGILNDPRRCNFDPAALLCKGGDSTSCLTQPQIEAVRAIYGGAHNPRTGQQIFPGWVRGSELLPDRGGSWAAYFVGQPEPARLDFWRYWVFGDPLWDPLSFDFDRDLAFADSRLSFVSAVNPDLSGFRSRGGRLLIYQGWADPVVPPEGTIGFYESIAQRMGVADTPSFARLFMVPGMGHCMGGPGPDTFDSLDVLDNWISSSRAPERIVARHIRNGEVDRTRPLCAWPKQAVYTGHGSTDDERNFACAAATRK